MGKGALIIGLALTTLGCAQHRLVVQRPNPTGESVIVQSTAFAFGTVQRRTVADCNTNLIDEVRVHQNLGQSLVTLLTLGAVMPLRIEYLCAKVPAAPPMTDD